MSIIKINGDLTGGPVTYNGIIIRKIDIPERFVNTIPHPMPTKKFLNEDDIVSILCDVIATRTQTVDPIYSDSERHLYSENFVYHNESGHINFSVQISNGTLIVQHVRYTVTISGEIE